MRIAKPDLSATRRTADAKFLRAQAMLPVVLDSSVNLTANAKPIAPSAKSVKATTTVAPTLFVPKADAAWSSANKVVSALATLNATMCKETTSASTLTPIPQVFARTATCVSKNQSAHRILSATRETRVCLVNAKAHVPILNAQADRFAATHAAIQISQRTTTTIRTPTTTTQRARRIRAIPLQIPETM